MAYTTQQAIETLNGYLNISDDQKSVIADTKNRGYIVDLNSGEQVVIFIYPLVHKQDNTKIILIQEIVVHMNEAWLGDMR